MATGNGGPRPGSGRKLGSKNKFPSHTKLHDEFLRHNFSYIEEFVGLYRQFQKRGETALQLKWFSTSIEFLFARRRPEDALGKPEEGAPADPDLLRQIASLMESK